MNTERESDKEWLLTAQRSSWKCHQRQRVAGGSHPGSHLATHSPESPGGPGGRCVSRPPGTTISGQVPPRHHSPAPSLCPAVIGPSVRALWPLAVPASLGTFMGFCLLCPSGPQSLQTGVACRRLEPALTQGKGGKEKKSGKRKEGGREGGAEPAPTSQFSSQEAEGGTMKSWGHCPVLGSV